MKKMLLLVLGLVGALSVQAQRTESPWTTAELANGTFYLYNVESGMWLQNNRRASGRWTTSAELGPHGFDFVLTALEDGKYQIDPRFGHNHSLNGQDDFLYMDTGRPVSPWTIEKEGLGYMIYCGTFDEGHFLYVSGDDELGWFLDDYSDFGTWQLVTKEARLADLEKATKANPKDATWLIDDWDFANQNDRYQSWKNEITGSGSGIAFREGYGGRIWNRAAECWSKGTGEFYQVLSNIPNGTYGLTVQGFYRDGSTSGVTAKYLEKTEEIRGWFFANEVSQPLMSICDNGALEADDSMFPVEQDGIFLPGDGGDALPRATNAFLAGYYVNPEIKVVVSDGTLRIGIRKESDVTDDWMCFDNFQLVYYGTDVDINEVRENLNKIIGEVNAYEGTKIPVLAEYLTAAEALKTSDDAKAIAAGANNLQNAFIAAKAMNSALAGAAEIVDSEWKPNFFIAANEKGQTDSQSKDIATVSAAAAELAAAVNDANGAIDAHDFFYATIPFVQKEGMAVEAYAAYKDSIDASKSLRAMNDALNSLRNDRKILNSDKQADVFAGNTPADGDFYLYNIGQQRFFCGGGDWGTHAYVGFPGNELTLIYDTYEPEEGEPFSGYVIDTHLPNGDNSEYLNYGGYVDTPTMDLWEFIPVEGKAGVYNIARANKEANDEGQRMLLGYTPNTYGQIDTDKYGESNPNNQWRLVSKADRDALLKTATVDNPQDASYKIQCPNFNQREDDSAWIREVGSIYGRGGNNPDFAFEVWNNSICDLSQVVYDLEPGWYRLGVQGYYREGSHEQQIRLIAVGSEAARKAELMTDDASILLKNITDEIDKAPGMGERVAVYPLIPSLDEFGEPEYDDNGDPIMVEDKEGELQYIGEFPKWIYQACNWFQTGLYKNEMLVQVGKDGTLAISVAKDYDYPQDWVVVDNFRLTYYGTEEPTPVEAVTDKLAKGQRTGAIYNLLGIPVQGQLKAGFYINEDGTKAILK